MEPNFQVAWEDLAGNLMWKEISPGWVTNSWHFPFISDGITPNWHPHFTKYKVGWRLVTQKEKSALHVETPQKTSEGIFKRVRSPKDLSRSSIRNARLPHL